MDNSTAPKERSGKREGGKPALATGIMSLIVFATALWIMHQPYYMIALMILAFADLGGKLAQVLGGWNTGTAITLIVSEVCALVLVGLYHVECGLIEFGAIVLLWVICRLVLKSSSGAGGTQSQEVEPIAEVEESPAPTDQTPPLVTATAIFLTAVIQECTKQLNRKKDDEP